jgi:hypothetical protein
MGATLTLRDGGWLPGSPAEPARRDKASQKRVPALTGARVPSISRVALIPSAPRL